MDDTTRINPRATTPPQSTDNKATRGGATPTTPEGDMPHDPRPETVHSNPQPGEFPAGPGNAGPGGHPEENASSLGTKWSTKNIAIGLGIAVLVIVVLMMVF